MVRLCFFVLSFAPSQNIEIPHKTYEYVNVVQIEIMIINLRALTAP